MPKSQRRRTAEERKAVVDLLLQMEPELKQLQGGVTILRALGDTTDSVQPIALAALAHSCDAGLDKVMELWRASLTKAR